MHFSRFYLETGRTALTMYAMYRFTFVIDANIVPSSFPLLSIVSGLQPTEAALAFYSAAQPVSQVVGSH